MADESIFVTPVQYAAEQKPFTNLSNFEQFVKSTVDEFNSLAYQLTFFRQIRADAKKNGNPVIAKEADTKIKALHQRVAEKKAEVKPVLDAIDSLPRRGF